MDIKYVIQNIFTLEYYWFFSGSNGLNGNIDEAATYNSIEKAEAEMFSDFFQDIVPTYSDDNDFIAFEIKKIYIPKD